MSYLGIVITYVFVSNFILVQFLGLCPFIGVSKNSESAIGMGLAVTFVTSVASVVCYMVYTFLLAPFALE
ncbi:MAG: electron transport complex subunit RsxA, partial [Spirochaetales bacterium]|nr:electron transport complex subunit RsxA [Spirochaetales bacterium]